MKLFLKNLKDITNSNILLKKHLVLICLSLLFITLYCNIRIYSYNNWEVVLNDSLANFGIGEEIQFRNIAYGNGHFIVSGKISSKGVMFISRDGLSWDKIDGFSDYDIRGIRFLGDQFYVFCRWNDPSFKKESDYRILTSKKGYSWNEHFFPDVYGVRSISYGNGKWVVVNGAGEIFYSNDFENWIDVNFSKQLDKNDKIGGFRDVAYGDHGFVAVGYYISSTGLGWGVMANSLDGINWNRIEIVSSRPDLTPNLFVRYINGRYIAGDERMLAVSLNGKRWEHKKMANASMVAYGNGIYVLVSNKNDVLGSMQITNDIEEFSYFLYKPFIDYHFRFLIDIAFGDDKFVAISDEGVFVNSSMEDIPEHSGSKEIYFRKGKNSFKSVFFDYRFSSFNYSYEKINSQDNDLPSGILFNAQYGYFYGTPEETGRWDILLKAEDKKNKDVFYKKITIIVNERYKISLNKNIDFSGDITGDGYYSENNKITLIARPFAGYNFIGWIKDDEVLSKDKMYKFKVTKDMDITAKFIKISDFFPYYGYEKWENSYKIDKEQAFIINFNKPLSLGWLIAPNQKGIYVKKSDNSIVPIVLSIVGDEQQSVRVSPRDRYYSGETYYLYIDSNIVKSRRIVGTLKLSRTIVMKFIVK